MGPGGPPGREDFEFKRHSDDEVTRFERQLEPRTEPGVPPPDFPCSQMSDRPRLLTGQRPQNHVRFRTQQGEVVAVKPTSIHMLSIVKKCWP
jgi:hypothetical protein